MSATTPATRSGTGLLTCGIASGVVYVLDGVGQFLFRDGLDLSRHQLSVSSNGAFGWTQIAAFIVTGALTVACAFGLRSALSPGRGERWVPILVGAYGAGLIAAGVFRADPIDGFPPGTPAGPPVPVSWHGVLHFVVASLAFLALIAACFVLARRFHADGRSGWRIYSLATAVVLLVTWLTVGALPGRPVVNVVFVISALHASVWVGLIAARLRNPN